MNLDGGEVVEKVHLAYGISDISGGYRRITAASIRSALENTTAPVVVHLLCDNTLDEAGKDGFRELVADYRQEIHIYNMDDILPADYFHKLDLIYFTKASMYRLMLGEILPEAVIKIIYLDADTIINLDIGALYAQDLGDYPLAAVPESANLGDKLLAFGPLLDKVVRKEDYFNAGVLVLNLELLRQTHPKLLDEAMAVLHSKPDWRFFDQDALNYLFRENYLKLPECYNAFRRVLPNSPIKPYIIHYTGHSFQIASLKDQYAALFFDHYLKTPFVDSQHLWRIVDHITQEAHELLLAFHMQSSRRKWVFVVGGGHNLGLNFPNILYLDCIAENDDQYSFNRDGFITFLNEHRSENYLYILLPYLYGSAKQALEDAGFKEKKDFIHYGYFWDLDSIRLYLDKYKFYNT